MALANVAVWLYRASIERNIWWALVNVAVWVVSSVYGEEHLVSTGECGDMGCIERLWRGTVDGSLVKVTLCVVTSGYGEGHLVGTGEIWRYGLNRAAMEGSWWALVNVVVWLKSSEYVERHLVGSSDCGGMP